MPFFQLRTVVLFLLLSHTAYSQATEENIQQKINKADSLFAGFTDQTPGVSVAVVRNGTVIFQKGYGLANLEYGIPVIPSTQFHAASLSKQFTAFCILLLQQQGLLSLDDDIRKYIPEMPVYDKPVTLQHLATHTSGLRDQWRLLEMAGWRLDDVIRKEQVLNLLYQQRQLNYLPGEKFMYCNSGYTLLAEVVERVSGKPLNEFAQKNIFDRLGMTSTAFNNDYESLVPGRAYSYHKEGTGYKKSNLNYGIMGATGLLSTPSDLSKWAAFLNAPPDAYKNMVAQLNTQAKLNDGTLSEAAYGQFASVTFHGLQWFDHNGSDAGFRSYLGRFPEYNAAVIVLANGTPVNANGLAISLADIFLKDLYIIKPRATPKASFAHDSSKFVTLERQQLQAFCGKYWQPDEWYNREIALVNDTLTYIRPGGMASRLVPVSGREFKMLGDKENVSVFFETGGSPAMRMVINNGKPLVFLKYTEANLTAFTGSFYSKELDSKFTITVKDKKLFAFHTRLGGFELLPVNKTTVTSGNRNFRKIVYTGKGFQVDNDGATGILFEKLERD